MLDIRTYAPPAQPRPMARFTVPIARIFWHCTADREGSGKGPDDVWQTHYVVNEWSHIGYHFLIPEDGQIWACRPVEYQGAGVLGENHDSLHICYTGGMNASNTKPKDTRTPAQRASLYSLTDHLLKEYRLVDDNIYGHNEFDARACPSFDVDEDIKEWRSIAGDPEPGMPSGGALGLKIAELEARVAELERWRRS